MVLSLFILTFLSSFVLTIIIRYFAVKKGMIDYPNERSSHSLPTPKGGGLGILIVFYTVLSYFFSQGLIDKGLFLALLAAIPVMIVSFIDDIFSLSIKVRLSVQLISACVAIYFLGGINMVDLISFSCSGSWLNLVALVAILWLTNLYNFLDGLDGYAASEAIFVGISSFILFHNEIGIYLALAVCGFLVFNWPKASLFMGDVGSATLGFIFAVLILEDVENSNFLAWCILLSLFWFDATITFYRRLKNGEKLTQAHKKHMYQRLHQAGWSHQKVLIASVIFNLLILFLLLFTIEEYYLYLLGAVLVILWGVLKYVDKQKGFE